MTIRGDLSTRGAQPGPPRADRVKADEARTGSLKSGSTQARPAQGGLAQGGSARGDPVKKRTAKADGSPSGQSKFGANGIGQTTTGLSNARTRIVGNRTGILADAIISIVRFARGIRESTSRWATRVADVVTALGWATMIAVVLAFVAGYRFGWIELVAVGFGGTILLLVAVVYLIGRTGVSVELVLEHSRVTVGQRAPGRVRVTNPSRRRALGSSLEIPIGTRTIEMAIPGIWRGASVEREFTAATDQRGVFDIGPVRTVRADPIGMVRREVVWTDIHELYVHPLTVAIPSTSTGLIRDLEGQPTRDLSNSDVSFHALREYVPGDERRYIHWKSTAKTGTYMVRQFEETRRSRLVVALTLASSDYGRPEEFEMAVSTAASLGIRAIRDARDISVIVGEKTPEFAKTKVLSIRQLNSVSRSKLLDDLAGVETIASSLGIVDVARVAADRVTGISVAFLVCGSSVTLADLRAASVQFPVGVEVVVVVCDPEAVPGLRRVAGLTVLTIGYLADLKASLARSVAI